MKKTPHATRQGVRTLTNNHYNKSRSYHPLAPRVKKKSQVSMHESLAPAFPTARADALYEPPEEDGGALNGDSIHRLLLWGSFRGALTPSSVNCVTWNIASRYGTSCSLNRATGSRGEVSQGMGPTFRLFRYAMSPLIGASFAGVGFETVRVVQSMESVEGAVPMGVKTALGLRISLIDWLRGSGIAPDSASRYERDSDIACRPQ